MIGVSLVNQADGKAFITHLSPDNDYYLFKTRPVPAGTYTLRLYYAQSPAPTVVAKDLKVAAGQTATATLDSGIALKQAKGSPAGT